MGVDYGAVCGIGTVIGGSLSNVEEWLHENFKGTLTDAEREEFEGDFQNFFDCSQRQDLPEVVCLNLYTGNDYFVGFTLASDVTVEQHISGCHAVKKSWAACFPDEQAQFVMEGRMT